MIKATLFQKVLTEGGEKETQVNLFNPAHIAVIGASALTTADGLARGLGTTIVMSDGTGYVVAETTDELEALIQADRAGAMPRYEINQ